MKRVAAVCSIALFTLLASGAASAGLFRAYLSSTGNDANDCTLPHPCRLLPRALAVVNDGGEVWMLDSANYNTALVSVTKSVTILAIPGALGSLVAPVDSTALVIEAGASSVTLRNLVVRDLSGSAGTIGITVIAGNNLRIESCEIYGVATGVSVLADGASATIVNTAIHDTGDGVLTSGATRISIDSVSIGSSAVAINAGDGARVTVSNSTLTDNNTGIRATAGSLTGTVVDVARSTVSAVDGVGFDVGAIPSLTAEIFVHSTTMHIGTGFSFQGIGGIEEIFSYGDNQLVYYSGSVVGGSLSPISGI